MPVIWFTTLITIIELLLQDFPRDGKFAPEVLKRETMQIRALYIDLCDSFKSYIKRCQEQDKEICFRNLYKLARNFFLLKDDYPAFCNRDPMILLSYIIEKQSYLNYFFLGEIIKKMGSQENKELLSRYDKEFKKYAANRFYKLPPDSLMEHKQRGYEATFVVSTDEHGFFLSEMYDFKERIGELLGISGENIYLHKISPG